MLGIKEFCALMAAGGIGAGSVVTVQKVTAPTAKVRAAPKVQKINTVRRAQPAPAPVAATAAAPMAALMNCPTIASSGVGNTDLTSMLTPTPVSNPSPAAGQRTAGLPPLLGPELGGGSVPGNLLPSPVPEPGTWSMMIMGVGLVGFALRRTNSARKPEETEADTKTAA